MKKICHITSIHGRYDTRIFMKQCKSLARNGYDVTLIVNDEKENEIIDNVKIISTLYKPYNRIDRFFNLPKTIYKKAININAEIYHLHDPDLLPIGNKLRKMGKKVIFDSHEDIPQQIKDKVWLPKFIRCYVSKAYSVYERYSFKKYDAIITVTPHIVERLKKINKNTIMVTNYPIIDKQDNLPRNPERAICFAGGIHEQYKHHNILKAIEKIPDVKYILAGIADNEYLNLLKELPTWANVEYLGKIHFEDVKFIYQKAIAGMAVHRSTQAKKLGSLGGIKLFEFMEAGLPVICTDYTLWKEIIDKYKCGICVNPDSIEDIKNAIEYLLDNPQKAEEMGRNGRNAIEEKYNWNTQAVELINCYNKL